MSEKYSGINKLLKIESLEKIKNKYHDGTFIEVIESWKWIFSFSNKYKLSIILYTILGILSSTFTLLSSYVSRVLINIITGQEAGHLIFLLIAMFMMTIFSLISSAIMNRISTKIGVYIKNDIQTAVFDSIVDAKWQDLNKYKNGDLLNRFNEDVTAISSNAISWIPDVIIGIYSFILVFIVLCKIDIYMGLIAIIGAPFLFLLSRIITQKLKYYRQEVQKTNSDMVSFEAEAFYNIDTIKSFGINRTYANILKKWQKKYHDINLDYNKCLIVSRVQVRVFQRLVYLFAFIYCLFRLYQGKILYGDMTFFLQQRSVISQTFSTILATFPAILNSSVSAMRIQEILALEKEKHDTTILSDIADQIKDGLSIEMIDVSYSYSDNKKVYENTSFIAKPNEIVAVMGESGGGKTTLFRLLLGLIEADEGSVILRTKEGKELKMNADLRELISYVPQGNSTILGSIAENLRMVKESASDEELINVLKMAYAYDFVKEIGLNGELGERAKGISEGQAQRLAIARALLKDAPILLLDEATSALDEDTEDKVLDSIMQNCPNKTVIVASHRPSVLKRCHRVYRINDKKINLSEN